jgi:hypothetical protein
MNTSFFCRASALGAVSGPADKMAADRIAVMPRESAIIFRDLIGKLEVLDDFTNIAVHKGSHKPGPIERRFQADVKYGLMDAKYYDQGELSIGNPPLVELVRELGSKNRPESAPTTLSAMAYEMARAVCLSGIL